MKNQIIFNADSRKSNADSRPSTSCFDFAQHLLKHPEPAEGLGVLRGILSEAKGRLLLTICVYLRSTLKK